MKDLADNGQGCKSLWLDVRHIVFVSPYRDERTPNLDLLDHASSAADASPEQI